MNRLIEYISKREKVLIKVRDYEPKRKGGYVFDISDYIVWEFIGIGDKLKD